MRVVSILSFVALLVFLAVIAGCERKVVNEGKSEDQELVGCFGCHGESLNGAFCRRPANGRIPFTRPELALTTQTVTTATVRPVTTSRVFLTCCTPDRLTL